MRERHPTVSGGHERPRIYVASLSDYNAGRLHGCWIDATRDPVDIHARVQRMLSASIQPCAEEWSIHDHEGFGAVRIPESSTFEKVSMIARAIELHGDAWSSWVARCGDPSEEGIERFTDAYRGWWPDFGSYAEQLLDRQNGPEGPGPELARGGVTDGPGMPLDDLAAELLIIDADGGGFHIFTA